MILFQLGWIRPVAIDPAELRLGRLALVVCVVASIAATLAAVVLLLQLRIPALTYLPSAVVPTVLATLNEAAEMCAWFAAINLVPLPPLTAMHPCRHPPEHCAAVDEIRLYAAIALAALARRRGAAGVAAARDAIAGLLPKFRGTRPGLCDVALGRHLISYAIRVINSRCRPACAHKR